MRIIDADEFVAYLKRESSRQKFENMRISKTLTVKDVIDAVIAELDGSARAGFKNAPTIKSEEDCDTCKYGYFGSNKCDDCRVGYPSHYERKNK